MAIDDFEQLKSDILNITQLGWAAPTLTANFGGGYQAGALVAPYGLHRWSLSADLIPDTGDYTVDYEVDGDPLTDPRFTYIFEFFKRHLLLGNKPFVFTNARTEKKYLVSFSETEKDFTQITGKIFSGGVTLIERRASGLSFNDDGSIDLDYTRPSGSLSISGSAPYSGIRVVTATVFDNVAVGKVQFFIDYELLSEVAIAPYTTMWNTTRHKNGRRVVSAKVFDTSGNTLKLKISAEVSNGAPDPYPPSVPVSGGISGTSTDEMLVMWYPSSDEEAFGAGSDDDYLL